MNIFWWNKSKWISAIMGGNGTNNTTHFCFCVCWVTRSGVWLYDREYVTVREFGINFKCQLK